MQVSVAAVVSIVFLLIVLTCIAVGTYLIVTSRRAVRQDRGPRCGSCGYNLTGSASNRCPECRKLFIEAGIVRQPARTSRVRLWVGIGLLAGVVPLFCLATGSVVMLRQAQELWQAEAVARMMTAQAQQHAVLARQRAEKASLEPKSQTDPVAEKERLVPTTQAAPEWINLIRHQLGKINSANRSLSAEDLAPVLLLLPVSSLSARKTTLVKRGVSSWSKARKAA